MDRLKDFKIGTRLSLVLACVLAALTAVALTGLSGLNAVSGTSQRVLAQDMQLAQQALEIQTLVLLERRYEKDAFISFAEAEQREGYVKRWADARAWSMPWPACASSSSGPRMRRRSKPWAASSRSTPRASKRPWR